MQELINLIRHIDVAANDQFAPFNRDGKIDIEAFMQVFVQDVFEDMDFMSQSFTDALEILTGIYHGAKQLGEFDYGGLPHYLVDDFAKFGFTLEDRLIDLEDHQRIIQTQNVILIIERFNQGEDMGGLDLEAENEDEDD